MKKETDAHFGQKIRNETSADRSSHKTNANEALMGRKCGGGILDVSHSLSGAGNVVTYNDTKGKGSKASQDY